MNYLIISLVIWLLPFNLLSQSYKEQTNQLWFGTEFEFRLYDEFSIEIENSLRNDLTNGILDNSFIQIAGSYKFLDYFKISATLRFKNSTPDWLSEYYTNLNANFPFGDLKLKLRTRYQNKDNIYRLKELLRQRISLEYNLWEKTSIEGSAELFYETTRDFIDRSRFKFGFNHKISKRNDLSYGYIFETQQNRNSPKNRDVLYIELSIRII